MSGSSVQRAVGEPLRLVVHERARHQPGAEVRAGDELERRGTRDRVDRHPDRAGLRPVDVVVRLVLMPRCPLRRARLLHEDVIVVEPDAPAPISSPAIAAAGDVRTTCSSSGRRCQLQKSSKNRPGSSGRLATSARSLGAARFCSIAASASDDVRVRERAANADGAVATERLYHGIGRSARAAAIGRV